MRRIGKFAIFQWRFIFFVAVCLLLAGASSFFSMGAREDPYLMIRSGVVVANYPGLTAAEVEAYVAEPIEAKLRQVPEVKEIKTTIQSEQAIFKIEMVYGVNDLAQVWDEVKENIDEVKADLPTGPGSIIIDDDFGDVAVITLAITSESFTHFELFDYAQDIRDRLSLVSGTNRVELHGAIPRQVNLNLDGALLQASGISLSDIENSVAAYNNLTRPGRLEINGQSLLIDVQDRVLSVSDILSLPIRAPGQLNETVYLNSLIDVNEGYADPFLEKAYFNGKQAIVIAVVMKPSENAIRYSDLALNEINNLVTQLPVGIDIEINSFQADQVKNTIYGVGVNVLQTILIVLIVMIVFLGFRAGIIAGSIIPIVMAITITVMSYLQIDLQRMSMATLIISLGLLVDNSVVYIEAYQRNIRQGLERQAAALKSVESLGLPLLTSSLTTMVFFFPLALAADPSGEYTRSISQVVIIALSVSWLVTFLFLPALCIFSFSDKKAPESHLNEKTPSQEGYIERSFRRMLQATLRMRWVVCGATVAFVVLGGVIMGSLPQKFFPNSDRSEVLVYVELPQGRSSSDTDETVNKILQELSSSQKYPEIVSHVAYVGFGGPRFVLSLEPIDASPNVAFLSLNLSNSRFVESYVSKVQQALNPLVPEARVRVTQMFLGPSDPNVMEIQVKGETPSIILGFAEAIENELRSLEGFQYADRDWYNPVFDVTIMPDLERLTLFGVSSSSFANQIQTYVQGRSISRFYEDDDNVSFVLRSSGAVKASLENLETIPIYSESQIGSRPLSAFSSIGFKPAYGRIQREDARRTVTVVSRNSVYSPEEIAPMKMPYQEDLRTKLPLGYEIEFDGGVEDGIASQRAIAKGAPLALFLIFSLLLFQFKSLRSALIVCSVLPLSLFGAALGLKVMAANFGFMVILGFFALFGIIINNAIILITTFEAYRLERSSFGVPEILDATTERLRPIFITTTTTVLGLTPLIVGKDVLFFGLSVVVAYGLALGTLVTLFFVPAIYSILKTQLNLLKSVQ